MAELFCVDPVEMEMELLNLQNYVQLKSQQHAQHFWSLVEPENYKNLCQAALKLHCLGLRTDVNLPSLTGMS